METQAQAGQIGFWQIYQTLAELLVTQYGVSVTDSTVLWLRGATEANAGRGAMSTLIRAYTETQCQLRYGTTPTPQQMQQASNAVAQNLLNDLLGRNAPQWPKGQVPDITRIAFADATAVGRELFGSKLGHDETDTAFTQNSAWSGALLFSMLGSDQTGKLISTGASPGAVDTLNDVRDVLYAAFSYAKALEAARSTFLSESVQQANRDVGVLSSTVVSYLSGPGTVQSLLDTVAYGAGSGPASIAIRRIAETGSNKFLDMLMGTVAGKSQIGTTTDTNFASRANTFFSAYGSTLSSIAAGLLPTSAGGLAGLARTDVNARAALAALSVVSVQVSSAVASQFSLYNATTGQGNITDNWITDRSAFTAQYFTQLQRGGGIVPGTQNLRFFDAASSTEVLVGAGAAGNQRVQYLFGGDAADTLTGFAFADHLYGSAGNDVMDGQGGADYVVMGHRHSPQVIQFERGRYINLGDWIHSFTYGVFDKDGFRIETAA